MPKPKPIRTSRRREPEHVEQKALIHWAALHEDRIPELKWLYAVPNGRYRTLAEAGKLKAEGVRRGVPDLALDVPREPYHGWRCEMKAPGGKPSAIQECWIAFLRQNGYSVCLADDWRLAWNDLCSYLGVEQHRQTIWPRG